MAPKLSLNRLGIALIFAVCGCALFESPKPPESASPPPAPPPTVTPPTPSIPDFAHWISEANALAGSRQCGGPVKFFMTDSDGIEFYKAGCADGSQMLIGCNEGGCREL